MDGSPNLHLVSVLIHSITEVLNSTDKSVNITKDQQLYSTYDGPIANLTIIDSPEHWALSLSHIAVRLSLANKTLHAAERHVTFLICAWTQMKGGGITGRDAVLHYWMNYNQKQSSPEKHDSLMHVVSLSGEKYCVFVPPNHIFQCLVFVRHVNCHETERVCKKNVIGQAVMQD